MHHMLSLPVTMTTVLALVAAGCSASAHQAKEQEAITNTAEHPRSAVAAPEPAPTTPATGKERHFARMELFVDAMCGCTDAACSKQVHADINTWNREHGKERGDFEDADYDRAEELAHRMVACDQSTTGP